MGLFAVIGVNRKDFEVCSGIRGIEELPPAPRDKTVYNLFET